MVYQIIKARKDDEGLRDNYWIIESANINPEAKLIANDYLESLKLANKSPATVDKYRWVIEMFLTYAPKPLDELESDDVLKWLNTDHKDKKEKTINLFISVLSGFFKYCLEEDYIKKVLVKHRWRPKIPSSIPKHLDSYEQARVKITAESMSVRNRAIVEFLLSSGCRRSEVASLNLEDIDLDNRTATVVGKGKKIREVHFSDECALLLKDYLREHKGENPALFINCLGNRLTGEGIYKITTKLGVKAGLPYNFNPHRCRHTFGRNMIAKGADIQFIGDELGHSDLNTTRVYTRIPSQDIIDEYNKKMGWI